jgi:hypothetical protein
LVQRQVDADREQVIVVGQAVFGPSFARRVGVGAGMRL